MTRQNGNPDVDQSTFLGGLRRGELAADHFTIVSNLVARDRSLSNAAKGLFVNMASHRSDFTITEEFLSSQCKDGVQAIRRTLNELRQSGYVYRGKRKRYPQGSRNAKGKDISGALGPYEWYVTDKPEEIAAILDRLAAEQAANVADESAPATAPADDIEPASDADEIAGQDYLSKTPVVLTSENSDPTPDELSTDLPVESTGSDDVRKHHKTAGHHNRSKPTVGKRRTLEDHDQKTIPTNTNPGGPAPLDPPDEEPPLRSGSSLNTAGHSDVVGTNQSDLCKEHQTARVRAGAEAVQAITDNPNITRGELEKVVARSNPRLSQGQVFGRAMTLLAWETKPASTPRAS